MWFFQMLRGQENFLACKYPALDPQGDGMFYISMDGRRVRSRLVDFAQAVPSTRNVFSALVSTTSLFSEALLKCHLLQGSAPSSPSRKSSLSHLNLQLVLVKDIRVTYHSPPSTIAILSAWSPWVNYKPPRAGHR